MNKTIITLAIVMGFNLHASAQDKKDTSMVAKVTGIGGIFFKCKDPKKTAQWYKDNLGIKSDAYGHTFKWYEDKAGKRIGRTVWSPFPESTDLSGQYRQKGATVTAIRQLSGINGWKLLAKYLSTEIFFVTLHQR